MSTPSRTPGDRDRALRAVRGLRLGAALLGTAAVGAFTGLSAVDHAATAVTSTASTATSTASTGGNSASTATPSAGAALSTPTSAPTAAPATAAPVTVSGGSSG